MKFSSLNMTEESLALAVTQYVTKVTIKVPDFWFEDPNLWFLHADLMLRNGQITLSRTKFDHIFQKLPGVSKFPSVDW